jgi:hypothetical protein
MARFNTQQSTIAISGATTLTYVIDKSTILLSGATGYTVTLSSPVPYPGSIQSIFNGTTGNITINTPAGSILGSGFTSAANQTIPSNSTYTLTSDGTNYVVTNNEGGPIQATTGTFSSTLTANSTVSMSPANANITISPSGTGTVTISPTGTVTMSPAGALTINPTAASTINNTSIGASTRSTGAFTTLQANNTVTLTGVITADTGANSQSHTTTGAGTITIASGTLGTINNMSIGATTASTGAFTTATATTAPSAVNQLTRKDYVDTQIAIQNAKAFYYNFV